MLPLSVSGRSYCLLICTYGNQFIRSYLYLLSRFPIEEDANSIPSIALTNAGRRMEDD